MGFILSIIIFTCITILGVVGVFALTGLAGLFSFGQAAFMAVGAYVAGLAVINLKLPFPVAILLGILVGMLVALVIGIPTLKLRKDYFSLVTFGFGEAIAALLNYFVNLTGGATGMSGIPRKTDIVLVVVSTVVVIWMVRNIKYSRFGRMCISLRNDELAAKSFGINVYMVKMQVFILSAAIAAYAGSLYGFYTTYVEPAMFGWTKSAEWVIIVFFGGINSLTGSVISAILLTALPEVLRFASEFRIVLYCALIIGILNFRPKGILGEYELNFNFLKSFGTKMRDGRKEQKR